MMMLFSRTNPRSKKRGRASQQSQNNKRDAKSNASRSSSGSNNASSLNLSLPPTIKRHPSGGDDSCSCSSTASLSSRTASTATASTLTENTNAIANSNAANAGAMSLDLSKNHRRKDRSNSNNRQVDTSYAADPHHLSVPKLDAYLAMNNRQSNVPSPLSESPRSSSSDESHDSSISSWQKHQPVNTCITTRSSTGGDPISHLENEVAKLSALIKRHRKYTPEWFVLDTKLSAAKEELIALREDMALDFLDMDEPQLNVSADGVAVGVPATVLVRSEEIEKGQLKEGNEYNEELECTPAVKMSATQQEYQEAVQKLNKVDKFSDKWFLLQEHVIELRTKVMEEAVKNATQLAEESPKEVDNSTLPSLADTHEESSQSYPVPAQLSRALSDSRPKQNSLKDDFYPAPYHERSSSLPSDAALFISTKRSLSPPLVMRYSPPSSPLVSRNLFPSSASINSSLYSQNDDDDENEEGSRLFSSMPQEDKQLSRLRSEYSEAVLKLDTLTQFSKEWFDLKTKIVQLEEQLESQENGSVGGLSHLSYGGVADRSSAAWSEEDDEIMSFASDLELCMIGEALKQGNCIITPFDNIDLISPIGNYEYCEDGDLLALDCNFPNFDEQENVAATLIQAQWRRHHQTKYHRILISSAVKVQAFVRCRFQVARYKQARSRLTKLRSSLHKSQASSKYCHILSFKSLVVLVQSTWRGHKQKKRFNHIRNATICMQSYARMNQQRKRMKKLSHVIHIQSVARGWLTRSHIHKDKVALSQSILQEQDSMHSTSILGEPRIQKSPRSHKSSTARPSVEVIQSHHRALSLRRSQVSKFSTEWLHITELLQGLELELRIREKDRSNDVNEVLSLEDSSHDSCSIPSMKEESSPSGHVMRIVQTIEANSRHSSPRGSLTSSNWTIFSTNASPKSADSTEEENLKVLGKECLRLTRKLDELPRFSDEWFDTKLELKAVTEELELLYEMMKRG